MKAKMMAGLARRIHEKAGNRPGRTCPLCGFFPAYWPFAKLPKRDRDDHIVVVSAVMDVAIESLQVEAPA